MPILKADGIKPLMRAKSGRNKYPGVSVKMH